jgi:hypothetical protein
LVSAAFKILKSLTLRRIICIFHINTRKPAASLLRSRLRSVNICDRGHGRTPHFNKEDFIMSRKRTTDQEPPAETTTAIAEPPATETPAEGKSFAERVGRKQRPSAPDPFTIETDPEAGVKLYESNSNFLITAVTMHHLVPFRNRLIHDIHAPPDWYVRHAYWPCIRRRPPSRIFGFPSCGIRDLTLGTPAENSGRWSGGGRTSRCGATLVFESLVRVHSPSCFRQSSLCSPASEPICQKYISTSFMSG